DDGKIALLCGPTGAWTFGVGQLAVERVAIGETRSPSISGDGGLGAWIDGEGLAVRAFAPGRGLHVGGQGAPTGVAVSADRTRALAGMQHPSAVREWNLADDSPVDWERGAFDQVNRAVGARGDAPLIVEARAVGRPVAVSIVHLNGGEATEIPFGDPV